MAKALVDHEPILERHCQLGEVLGLCSVLGAKLVEQVHMQSKELPRRGSARQHSSAQSEQEYRPNQLL